jgi:hypothetical protein
MFNFKIFSDGKFVSANHILQNFPSAENFPECKWVLSYRYFVVFSQLGPQMSLQLIKIEEGMCTGEVLFHEFGNYFPLHHLWLICVKLLKQFIT